MTLTEISEILTSQDAILQKTLLSSQELFSNFIILFDELSREIKGKNLQNKPRLEQILSTANEFIKKHDDSIIMVWSLTKRLFELTEQLAEKEIESDPKGFIMRESFSNKRNSQQ